MAPPLVLLAAGGTGGHLFPAEALAHALAKQGVRVALATDARVSEHLKDFPAEAVYRIPAATPSKKSPLVMARAFFTLGRGIWTARKLLRYTIKPACVVGFGGYPSVPPLAAGAMVGAPTLIHEQNAVMGRANRFLAPHVTAIATGFPIRGLPDTLAAKATHVGNPVRAAVIEAAAVPFASLTADGRLRLLVFGGSQGARVMADVVPAAIALLPDDKRRRLAVTQQVRVEDLARVTAAYASAGVAPDARPFFSDLPRRIAESHLIVARAGASTVAELAVIGRPSILVPLPGALDQDQAANAATLGSIDAAAVILQPDFTPKRLAQEIAERLEAPERLTQAAEAAKSAGIADAAERLAALALKVGRIA
jgi:UDP-N-acetylglucosamine--N-acetylmuramyl-(pentapeptide) pyrophosphoryl-undecaprenol N-acetylglucosamine transferase